MMEMRFKDDGAGHARDDNGAEISGGADGAGHVGDDGRAELLG